MHCCLSIPLRRFQMHSVKRLDRLLGIVEGFYLFAVRTYVAVPDPHHEVIKLLRSLFRVKYTIDFPFFEVISDCALIVWRRLTFDQLWISTW
jgi:hypothetical protein